MLILANKLLRGNKLLLIVEIFVLLLIYSAIFYTFCDDDDFSGINKEEYKTSENRFLSMFYFSCVTCSTIGYGDIYPKTIKSRFISLTLIFIVLFLSLI